MCKNIFFSKQALKDYDKKLPIFLVEVNAVLFPQSFSQKNSQQLIKTKETKNSETKISDIYSKYCV